MPGGSPEAYPRVQALFEAVAARVDGEPCVTWLGSESVGHYVKMVHNGIEYGLMQLIAESYDFMKRGLGLDNHRLQQIYQQWSRGVLNSFLLEITADIFGQVDDCTGMDRIDVILDAARQKRLKKSIRSGALRPTGFSTSILPPSLVETVAGQLNDIGLCRGCRHNRLVVERPFGRDLVLAPALDRILTGMFAAAQIYRIDHYLGKETV